MRPSFLTGLLKHDRGSGNRPPLAEKLLLIGVDMYISPVLQGTRKRNQSNPTCFSRGKFHAG